MQPGDDKRSTPNQPRRSLHGKVSSNRRSLLRLAAVLVIALVAGLVVWLVVGKSDNSSKSSSATKAVVSEQGLQKLVTTLGAPVFWAGPEQGARYGIEQRSNGQVYVRYLTTEMKADTVATLTVGTYPMKSAYSKTVALGKKSGWKQLTTGVGGVAAFTSSAPSRNVYLAQPSLDYQIEVYDPTPGRAAALVQAGRVIEVQEGERLGLTLAELKTTVAASGKPVYWVGPKPGVTYEYTHSSGGSVYIRYLPKGAAVGSANTYLTVGTYPMKAAFATTERAAARAGEVRLPLTRAVAFYNTAKPTSVYVAFEDADFQIEVYDPVPKRSRALVSAGDVKPLG